MLSYRELEQEVERLRRENASLKAELSELRSRYGVEDTPKESTIETVLVEQSEGINKYSTPDEKNSVVPFAVCGKNRRVRKTLVQQIQREKRLSACKTVYFFGKDDNLTVINSDNYSDNRQ